jgi:hypothetical protein
MSRFTDFSHNYRSLSLGSTHPEMATWAGPTRPNAVGKPR